MYEVTYSTEGWPNSTRRFNNLQEAYRHALLNLDHLDDIDLEADPEDDTYPTLDGILIASDDGSLLETVTLDNAEAFVKRHQKIVLDDFKDHVIRAALFNALAENGYCPLSKEHQLYTLLLEHEDNCFDDRCNHAVGAILYPTLEGETGLFEKDVQEYITKTLEAKAKAFSFGEINIGEINMLLKTMLTKSDTDKKLERD